MKLILFVVIISVLFFTCISALEDSNSNNITQVKKITASEKYYPLSVGNQLYFKAYKKDNPAELIKLKVEIKEIKEIDEERFFYLNAPKLDIRYLLRRDENGLYMRMIKYPFFFFGAINVNINPPLNVFKFPAKVGLQWESDGKAEVSILFFNIERNINAKFEIADKILIVTEAGILEAFLIYAWVNHGKNEDDIKLEKFWYAKGIGYSRADTATHFAEIVGYRIRDEESGKWNENLPENPEEFQ